MHTIWTEFCAQADQLLRVLRGSPRTGPHWFRWLPTFSFVSALVMIGVGLVLTARAPASRYTAPPPTEVAVPIVIPAPIVEPIEVVDLTRPVRETPTRFPAHSRRPAAGEGNTSISIDSVSFQPDRDLVEIYDDRVWWESDNDRGDTENDHQIHAAMEIPLRRLIELVSAEGGTLKIQDTYRATGIHAPLSLHKQGRAVDLTCDELGLERLAALTWAAGFDWVYYEAPKRGGHHVHASVRP